MNVKDIKTIGMYGAGTIGGGFAAILRSEGPETMNVYVRSEASKERRVPHIQGPIDSYVKLGLLDDGQKIWEKIKITTDPPRRLRACTLCRRTARRTWSRSMRWWP